MRKGEGLIESKSGMSLEKGLVQSFVFNGEIEAKFNVLYLKFDDWIHVSVSDEGSIIKLTNRPEKIASFEMEGNEFDYPLERIEDVFEEFNTYLGCKLKNVREIVLKEHKGFCCGLKFYFETGDVFSIFSNDDDNTLINFDGIVPDEMIEK